MEQKPSYKEMLKSGNARKPISHWQRILGFFLFVVYNIVCVVAAVFYRCTNWQMYSYLDKDFMRYYGCFGFWQLTGAWTKAQEAMFFRCVELKSPSLEVGIHRGDISDLHFIGKKFDIGTEYLHFVGAKAAKDFNLWNNVYSDDIHNMALKDESLNIICMVHIVDHLEDIEKVIREIARVMKKGGRIYFSGFTDTHYNASIIWRLLNIADKATAKKYANFLSQKRVHHNLFSMEKWRELLSCYNLRLDEYYYFQSGSLAYISYFLHYVCFHNHCFGFKFFKTAPLLYVFEKLYRFYYISIGYPFYLNTKSSNHKWGDAFFAVASKIGK